MGGKSPVSINTETKYQYLKFKKGGCLTTSIHENRNEVIYIISGKFEINNQQFGKGESLLISNNKGDSLEIKSQFGGSMVKCIGKPHNEPICQHGPYVD